jgi:hypothetical protein
MRTTTAAKGKPATATGRIERAAAKRGRARPGTEAAAAAAPEAPLSPEPASVAVSAVRMLKLDEGLYALRIGRINGNPGEIAGMAVPVAHVSAPFAEDGNGVEIVASFPRRGPWLEREGGAVIIRSPLGGGYVIIAVYGQPGEAAAMPSLDLRRLDRPDEDHSAQAAGASASPRSRVNPKRLRPKSSSISNGPAIACSRGAAGWARSAGSCASKPLAFGLWNGSHRQTSSLRGSCRTATKPSGLTGVCYAALAAGGCR